MRCPLCGREVLTSIRIYGGTIYACPCVPPNTATLISFDSMPLAAIRLACLASLNLEHDPGDEDRS